MSKDQEVRQAVQEACERLIANGISPNGRCIHMATQALLEEPPTDLPGKAYTLLLIAISMTARDMILTDSKAS